MASAVRCGVVLRRSWDRLAIAWPFTRVDVVLGSPIEPGAFDAVAQVQGALARLTLQLGA